jgi:hypothetical protein
MFSLCSQWALSIITRANICASMQADHVQDQWQSAKPKKLPSLVVNGSSRCALTHVVMSLPSSPKAPRHGHTKRKEEMAVANWRSRRSERRLELPPFSRSRRRALTSCRARCGERCARGAAQSLKTRKRTKQPMQVRTSNLMTVR